MENNDPADLREPRFAIPKQVYMRPVDGQMVLLNLESEEYFGLDEVGSNIVGKLIAMAPDHALAQLEDDYEVAPETLRQDVEALVKSLVDAGLLVDLKTHVGESR